MTTVPQNLQPGDAVGTPPLEGTSPAQTPTASGNATSSGAGMAPPGTLPSDPVASMFDAATTAVTLASKSLGSNLLDVAPGETPRVNKSRDDVQTGVLAMATVLTQFPAIAAMLSPTQMVAGVVQVQAGERLATTLRLFATQVENTVQVTQNAIWKNARDGYHNARRVAADSSLVTAAIEPLVEILAVQPRETTAVLNAATDTVKATKANGRATKANSTAANSRQRAKNLAPEAMASLSDGTGDATIAEPAPSGNVPGR